MASYPGWQQALLRIIGAPATKQNIRFLDAWQRSEGGSARFNPLNTTFRVGGAGTYNSVGVKNYASPQQGAMATARTLLNGRYGGLVAGLRSGSADPRRLAQILGASPWGTSGELVSKVLGSGGLQQPANHQVGRNNLPAFAGQNLRPPGQSNQVRLALAQQLISNLGQIGQHQIPDYQTTYQLIAALHAPGQRANEAPSLPVLAAGPITQRDRQVVNLAKRYLGTPYVWGGSRPGGFDCSGLLQYVWGQRGVHIPRTSEQQWKFGRKVSPGKLRPGDAVFFEMRSDGPGHVGMYIGNGKFIEAPHTGAVVRISTLKGRSDFVGARRYT